jgi:hypothetical protein
MFRDRGRHMIMILNKRVSFSEIFLIWLLVIDLSTTLSCSDIVDSNFAWLSFTKSFDMGIYKICDIDVVPNASSICSGVISSTNLKEQRIKYI